jgi:hypothetical protein
MNFGERALPGGSLVLASGGKGSEDKRTHLSSGEIKLGYVYQCVSERRDGYFGVLFRCTEISHNQITGVVFVPLSSAFRETLIVQFGFDEIVVIGPSSVHPKVDDIGATRLSRAA